MSNLTLSSILSKNQLVWDNYINWKCNLLIVLSAKKPKFALIEPYHNEPTVESVVEQMTAYEKWVQSNEMASCYIMASKSNVLK